MRNRLLMAAVFAAVLSISAICQQSDKVSFEAPKGVKVMRDIEYAKYGQRALKLDLYEPAKRDVAPLPSIVVIRGGGWNVGDKEGFAPMAGALAARGFVAVSVEYRTSKEAVFPAAVEDTKAAVRWLRANAKKYGLDPNAIGAIGGSAGAHLAVMLGVTRGIARLEGTGGNNDFESSVQAVVGLATPADFSGFSDAEMNSANPIYAFLGKAFKEDPNHWAFASPVSHVTSESAPLLLIQSESDDTVPFSQSLSLAERYAKAGVPVDVVLFPDGPHAFWWDDRWFGNTIDRSAAFFSRYLSKSDER